MDPTNMEVDGNGSRLTAVKDLVFAVNSHLGHIF
jgi:hypothetical protein